MARDLGFENHGSLWLVRPHSKAGKAWLERTAPEDAQILGSAMACEPRYVRDVMRAALDEGLTV